MTLESLKLTCSNLIKQSYGVLYGYIAVYKQIGNQQIYNYRLQMGCEGSKDVSAPVNQLPPKSQAKASPQKQQPVAKNQSPSKSNQQTPRNPQKSPEKDKKLSTEPNTTVNNNLNTSQKSLNNGGNSALASSTKSIGSPSKVKLDIKPVDERPQLKKTIKDDDKDKKKTKKKKATEDKKLSELIRVYEL